MHIGIVIWGLTESRGGIQRVGSALAVKLSERGHGITIFIRSSFQTKPLYAIPETAKLVFLPLSPNGKLEEAQAAINESGVDVFVAMFSWRDLMWFPWLLKKTGIPLICSEHNFPPIISNERWNPREHFGCLATADHIHILVEGYKNFYPPFLRERMTVIGNPSPKACLVDWDLHAQKKSRTIIAVGRFVESHKQFLLLIKAFARLADKFPDWNLVICGDGPDRDLCIKMVKSSHLENRISLPGDTSDVNKYYASADLFCIPSRHEGFPMTVGEAAAHGLPLVGFAGCPGVNALIVPWKNGLLAPEMTEESLAQTLSLLMSASVEKRQKMGQEAQNLSTDLDADIICDQWEALLEKAVRNKGNTVLQCLDSVSSWTSERLLMASLEIIERPHPFIKKGSKRKVFGIVKSIIKKLYHFVRVEALKK